MFVFLCILLVGAVDTCQAYTMMGDVNSYERDGYNITFNCENGKVRLSFLREDLVRVHMAPEPIALDVYPDESGPSGYVMYDCETVRSPIKKTTFKCSEDKTKIDISISASSVAYELWVHYDKAPALVIVDSKVSAKIKDKSGYDAAKEGWYWGAGCFYGSADIKTLNIKVPKSSKSHFIRITK